jgi:hypothetical protein
MGFSFRRKASDAPLAVSDGVSTGQDVSSDQPIDINPEADLKKFKKLHKWDPFMEVDKLDAADQVCIVTQRSGVYSGVHMYC